VQYILLYHTHTFKINELPIFDNRKNASSTFVIIFYVPIKSIVDDMSVS